MTRIKVCGNTELVGVLTAVDLGVDLLGFIFTRSKRQVTIDQAKALIREVPEAIGKVGVFIDEPASQIGMVAESCGLTAIQIYRKPTAADRALGLPMLVALRLRDANEDLPALEEGDHPLLDTWAPDAIGGTGQTWDWSLAESLAQRYPIIVSGGLTPENVRAAIDQLHPWGVDVSSGVERTPGVKDPIKLERFVRAAREMDAALAQDQGAVP